MPKYWHRPQHFAKVDTKRRRNIISVLAVTRMMPSKLTIAIWAVNSLGASRVANPIHSEQIIGMFGQPKNDFSSL